MRILIGILLAYVMFILTSCNDEYPHDYSVEKRVRAKQMIYDSTGKLKHHLIDVVTVDTSYHKGDTLLKWNGQETEYYILLED